MAVKIHSPLDNGHQPFKRLATLGPGPKKRKAIKAKEMYDCNKSEKYVQVCTILKGSRAGATFKVVTDPKTKRKYNKLYNENRTRAAPANTYRKGFTLKKAAKLTAAGKASVARGGVSRYSSARPGRSRR